MLDSAIQSYLGSMGVEDRPSFTFGSGVEWNPACQKALGITFQIGVFTVILPACYLETVSKNILLV